jgi:hypothetical protein
VKHEISGAKYFLCFQPKIFSNPQALILLAIDISITLG